MNPRARLTAADLFVLLDREFRRRKPRECAGCFVQLPYRVDAKGDEPNWEIATPADCGRGCGAIFDALVQELQTLYALENASGDERA